MYLKKEPLYLKIANMIEEQIASETLKLGDKLPSIRSVQKIYNVSINTAKQAFFELESKSLIEPRPRSGYFVSKTSQRKFSLPSVSKLQSSNEEKNPEDLIDKVFNTLKKRGDYPILSGGSLPKYVAYRQAEQRSYQYCTQT